MNLTKNILIHHGMPINQTGATKQEQKGRDQLQQDICHINKI